MNRGKERSVSRRAFLGVLGGAAAASATWDLGSAEGAVRVRHARGKAQAVADKDGLVSHFVAYPKGTGAPKEIALVQSDVGFPGVRHIGQRGVTLAVCQAPPHHVVHLTFVGFWW